MAGTWPKIYDFKSGFGVDPGPRLMGPRYMLHEGPKIIEMPSCDKSSGGDSSVRTATQLCTTVDGVNYWAA